MNYVYKDLYNPLISLTAPYLFGTYSNCQPLSNITVSYFSGTVLDLTKCNTTYQINSTVTPGLYAKVTLNCSTTTVIATSTAKSAGLKNVSLNGIILLLIALISYNYSKM